MVALLSNPPARTQAAKLTQPPLGPNPMDIEAVKNTLTHNAAGDIELGVRGPSPPLGANRMDIED